MIFLIAIALCVSGAASAQIGGGSLPTLLQLNVESAEIDGVFTRNEVPFPSDFLDSGQVHLESSSGDPFVLGNTGFGAYGPRRVVDGSYESQFSSFAQPATAPRGDRTPFGATVSIENDQILDFDVPAVEVTLTYLMNGQGFPGGSENVALFLLRNVATGREVQVGTTQDLGSTFSVVPGVYDVIYAYQSGALIPANTRAVILRAVLIDQSTSLDVDVPMIFRTFSYSLNGAPFPASGLDYGFVYLEEEAEGAEAFRVGRTSGPDFLRLIPGTYRVIYSYQESQTFSPRNPWAIVDEGVVVEPGGLTGIEVSVTAHSVTPEFLLDGLNFPASGLANGRIELRGGDGSFVSLGSTDDVPDSVVLIEGTYDFYYSVLQDNAPVPVSPKTRFASDVFVNSSGPLALNVQTGRLGLGLLLDGEDFPFSGLNYGRILLVDTETGEERDLGRSYESPFVPILVQGEYDIVYEYRENAADLVPQNRRHVIEPGIQVGADLLTTTVDVQTRLMAPRFSLDGANFPTTPSESGRFALRNEEGDEVILGDSFEAAQDVRVIEGVYRADYEWQDGSDVPVNPREQVRTVYVPEPNFGWTLCVGLFFLQGAYASRLRSGASL
ncbi:MAG: hypothetical protein AB8G23_14055 [Myxococcota bacterium]